MSLITDQTFYLNLLYVFLFTVQNPTTCSSISCTILICSPGHSQRPEIHHPRYSREKKKRDNYDKKSPSELLFFLFFFFGPFFCAAAERNPEIRCFCFLVSENPTFKDNLERARAGISSPGTSTLFKESGTTLGELRQIWGRQGGREEARRRRRRQGGERADDEAGR